MEIRYDLQTVKKSTRQWDGINNKWTDCKIEYSVIMPSKNNNNKVTYSIEIMYFTKVWKLTEFIYKL